MQGDPLTEIVRSLHLTGGVFLEATLTAPWAIVAHISESDCEPFMPAPKQVIAYHVVTEGRMVVEVEGALLQTARSGDVVFLPSNAPHTIASEAGLAATPGDDLALPAGDDGLAKIRVDGGGERTGVLCGFIASNSGSSPLLETLPVSLIIKIENLATRRWLESSIALAARELTAGRISSRAVMAQLSELLLIEALRAYCEADAPPTGWLRGIADPKIAQALAAIHKQLATPVSVDALATDIGMSRSAFVRRFTDLVGQPPGGYLQRQRIEAARLMLRETPQTVAEIAYRVGYEAPEAFSRAFKRTTGLSPAEWRASS